jgi:hypothetical protein
MIIAWWADAGNSLPYSNLLFDKLLIDVIDHSPVEGQAGLKQLYSILVLISVSVPMHGTSMLVDQLQGYHVWFMPVFPPPPQYQCNSFPDTDVLSRSVGTQKKGLDVR